MGARNSTSSRRERSDICVLLADDHPLVRDGVQSVLERQPDVRVVAAVGDGSAAIREAERLRPNVIIMDITMPGMNGIEATRVIVDRFPEIGVVVLSMHSSPIIVRRAIEAGARGYLAKDAAADELVRAVRMVAQGKRYIGQGLAQSLLDVHKPVAHGSPTVESLTATERNILRLVVEGKSNREIATLIALSPRTVETYRLRLMRKLGIENLPSLVRYAIRHGIVPLD
jgi:DNA-binding NarL/FixJ family response regulator